ncbi:hypothetical protein SAMN04487976_11742 [Xaviernesmea oryzae]|nr:hypothetical protein SAMN04487976_11742 [Xaviernesmea oryzae]
MSPRLASGTRLSAQTCPGSGTARSASRTTGSHHFAAQNRCPCRRFAVADAIPDPLRAAPGVAPVFHETGGDHGALSAHRGTAGRTQRVHRPAREGADHGRASGGRGRTGGPRGGTRQGAGGGRLSRHSAIGAARPSAAPASCCSQTPTCADTGFAAIGLQTACSRHAISTSRAQSTGAYTAKAPAASTLSERCSDADRSRRVRLRMMAPGGRSSSVEQRHEGRFALNSGADWPVTQRIAWWRGSACKGECSAAWKGGGGTATERGQDKGPRGAASVGCGFSRGYQGIARGAETDRTSPPAWNASPIRDLVRCVGRCP